MSVREQTTAVLSYDQRGWCKTRFRDFLTHLKRMSPATCCSTSVHLMTSPSRTALLMNSYCG